MRLSISRVLVTLVLVMTLSITRSVVSGGMHVRTDRFVSVGANDAIFGGCCGC